MVFCPLSQGRHLEKMRKLDMKNKSNSKENNKQQQQQQRLYDWGPSKDKSDKK